MLAAVVQVHDEMEAGKEEPGSERHLMWPHYRNRLVARVVDAYCAITDEGNPDPHQFPWRDEHVCDVFTKFRKESKGAKDEIRKYLDT